MRRCCSNRYLLKTVITAVAYVVAWSLAAFASRMAEWRPICGFTHKYYVLVCVSGVELLYICEARLIDDV